MFARLGRAVVAHPWRVIAIWVVAAIVIVGSSPGLPKSTSESDALPRHYESIRAMKVHDKAFPAAFNPSVLIVAKRPDGGPLTPADQAKVRQIATQVQAKHIPHVERVVAGEPSPNKLIQTIGVQMPDLTGSNQKDLSDSVKKLRADLKPIVTSTGLQAGTTGTVAQNLDQQEASGSADAIIAMGTVVLIIVLLLVIFRSPIIAFLPVIVVGVASAIANGLIADVVKAFGLKTDSSVNQILIVVLFGVGTDYILFLMFRYRERLRRGEDRREAMVNAVSRVGEAIASAAGVVIIAFMAMALSSLGFFRSMGPALAIAVAVTLLAGLTLVPAVTSLIGPKVFWPSKSWQREPKAARFAALGRAMARRPGVFAAASGAVMVVLALFALSYNPTFDLASGSMPKTAESQVWLRNLEAGLPKGATDPTNVYVSSANGQPLDQAALTAYGAKLRALQGVGSVSEPQLSKDRSVADFSVILKTAPEADTSLSLVKGPLRSTAHGQAPPGTTALVGGITSVYVDIQAAMNHDYSLVFPVAAVLIMLVLALLLRSLVAPWYLIASVGLGFAATLGATVIVFQEAAGQHGLIFMLPLIMYMFVVALGTDYNILMTARLREEAKEGLEPREALAQAIKHTGPTIAAAGVILAGSFGVLTLGGGAFLQQLGFALAFGILFAAFAMAMFFTPSLTALIGHLAWWPGHGDESDEERAARLGARRGGEREPVA